jgi:hypothetical protein
LGCLTAARVGGGANDSLAVYIKGYLAAGAAGEVSAPSLFSLIWDSFRYALIAALFGFTSLGGILMPLLMAVRGFFLSFAAASLSDVGGDGLLLARVCSVFSDCRRALPLRSGVQGLSGARVLAAGYRRTGSDVRQAFGDRFGICFLVLTALCCYPGLRRRSPSLARFRLGSF